MYNINTKPSLLNKIVFRGYDNAVKQGASRMKGQGKNIEMG